MRKSQSSCRTKREAKPSRHFKGSCTHESAPSYRILILLMLSRVRLKICVKLASQSAEGET